MRIPRYVPPNVVEGADVTQSNGPVTWSSVQGSGRGFAFARVSQGDYHTDNAFALLDVSEYIEGFYNPPRRHSYLGGVSPDEFEAAHRQRRSGVH